MLSLCGRLMKKVNSEWQNGSKMSQTITIQLERPIKSVNLFGNSTHSTEAGSISAETTGEHQNESLRRLFQVLQNAANKANEFQEVMFKGHKEQIAKLSVEIARKILVKEIKNANYDIEAIVNKALNSAPTRKDLVVYLNPEDFARLRNIQQDKGSLSGVTFIEDGNIGKAECRLESPKGRIASLIDEQLIRIEEALVKVE